MTASIALFAIGSKTVGIFSIATNQYPGPLYPVFIIAHTMIARTNAPRITYVMMSALPGIV